MALTPESTQYATREEAQAAIQSLQKSDFAKLMIIARSFVKKRRLSGAVAEPEDLLQETIVKTLAGPRRWSRAVDIIRHLDRVMESDSGHLAERRTLEAKWAREHMHHPDVHPETAPLEPSPEVRLQARDALAGVLTLFAEDEDALRVIRLKGDDLSASEIRRELGMSKMKYDTVTNPDYA